MKKILLAAAFSAFASLSAFGTACTSLSGLTISQVNADIVSNGFCTINGWQLSSFGLGQSNANAGFGNVAATSDDLFVNFNVVSSPGGGAGFSVTYSDATGGQNYLRATSSNQTGATANFVTYFVIENGPAVQNITSEVTGASVAPSGNNGSIQLQKIITNPNVGGNPTIGDGFILTTALGTSTNPLTIGMSPNSTFAGNTLTRIGVMDNYQIASGNTGTASLTSYTNTFYAADPVNDVPEPMTFVLMGAGLVGIAALRRRNG